VERVERGDIVSSEKRDRESGSRGVFEVKLRSSDAKQGTSEEE